VWLPERQWCVCSVRSSRYGSARRRIGRIRSSHGVLCPLQ
jgi:hypothetical protein